MQPLSGMECSCSVGVELACTEPGSGEGGNVWVAVTNGGRVGSIGIVTNWSLHKCSMCLLKMAVLLGRRVVPSSSI